MLTRIKFAEFVDLQAWPRVVRPNHYPNGTDGSRSRQSLVIGAGRSVNHLTGGKTSLIVKASLFPANRMVGRVNSFFNRGNCVSRHRHGLDASPAAGSGRVAAHEVPSTQGEVRYEANLAQRLAETSTCSEGKDPRSQTTRRVWYFVHTGHDSALALTTHRREMGPQQEAEGRQ